ncbi:MAG: hypothetical protein DMG97_17900 [Acidobacteria bacterium]|nr:MAG: hypothetical protein DMG97_17900 [Acidobacteriota bacterium]PYV79894.1 MAG: hypothetical protein DMG96_02405 [Acidobacteriota bacterium]
MGSDARVAKSAQPFLRVRSLTKRYVRGGVLQKRIHVDAVRGIDLEIPACKTLALVGSSGSGKSTVARCVTRLERPDAGEIWVGGTDIAGLANRALLTFRAAIQMICQDAVTSMNPRFSAAETVEEPLLIQRRGAAKQCRQSALEIMSEVGVSADWANRSVMEFSGGQRQRLAIARALVLQPKLLVLDEALSGLDLSTEAEIINLLLDVQAAHSLTYLFISHDLPLMARLADTIAVMCNGTIVEQGPKSQLLSNPSHPETKSLLLPAKIFQKKYAEMLGVSG